MGVSLLKGGLVSGLRLEPAVQPGLVAVEAIEAQVGGAVAGQAVRRLGGIAYVLYGLALQP